MRTVPMILLQFHPEYYQAETADSMLGEGIDKALHLTMSAKQEAFWGILSDSAKAHRTKKAILRQIPKVATLKKSTLINQQTAALEKIEDKDAKVFNLYKKDYFNWKKGLLQIVENSPEKLLYRYLSSPVEGEPDHFFYEREVLQAALKFDVNFLQSLMNKTNRESILKVIQETDLQLYQTLQDTGRIGLSSSREP